MRIRFGGLWRHADFRRVWAAQTVSAVGSEVSLLAIPLVAALLLGAGPLQMGLLVACEYLPTLLGGLIAGAWVDRVRRRPVLIAADLGRAAALLSIPVAAWLGVLGLGQLYAVALVVGVLALCFDVADQSFLPTVVGREDLIEANGKLEASRSVAEIGGPGLAGVAVQVLGAPIAVLADALSFLASAWCLGRVRAEEAAPEPPEAEPNLRAEIAEGVRLVVRTPALRALAGWAACSNLSLSVVTAVLILYATRDLGLAPALIGVVFAAASVGSLAASLLVDRAADHFGVGRTMVAGQAISLAGTALIPVAGGSVPAALAVLIAAELLMAFGSLAAQINAVSLRQGTTPDHLLGRVSATTRVLTMGLVPVGAVLGGTLAEVIGMRPTLALAVVPEAVALVWLCAPAIRGVRSLDETEGLTATPLLAGAAD